MLKLVICWVRQLLAEINEQEVEDRDEEEIYDNYDNYAENIIITDDEKE